MAYGLNPGGYGDETPEERRMRLLAEMNPFTPRAGMGENGSIDSRFPLGMMPQGMMGSGQTFNTPERGTFVEPGPSRSDGPAWRDPGSDGPGTVYQDPPTTGILSTKVGESSKPEFDGILFGGTRSAPGTEAFMSARPRDSLQSGPDVAAPGINVTGANGSDRNNVPRSPDAPANAASPSTTVVPNPFGPTSAPASPAPPAGAPSSFPTPARQPRAAGAGGLTPAPGPSAPTTAPGAPATGPAPALPQAPGAAGLPQPQIAAVADGLSRTPGSPDAMNWLKENADLFIGLGAGLLSGKNIGEGILHGLRMANESKVASAKEKELLRKNQSEQLKTATYAAMVKQAYPNISSEQAIGIAQSPAMMNEVFKATHPSEQWQQQGGENGQPGFLRNARTGDIKADPSRPGPDAATKETRDLVTPEDRRAHGIPDTDKGLYKWSKETGLQAVGQAKMYPSPDEAAQTKANTARVESQTGMLDALAKKRLQAQGNVSTIDRLDELLGQIDTGAKTAALENFRKSTGIALDSNASKVQAVSAVVERIANAMHDSGTGPMTDRDIESFRLQVPTLVGTPEGNRLVSETLRGMAEHTRDATAIAAQWQTGKLSPEKATEALNNLKDPFSRMREYQAARTPAAPAAGGAGGAGAPSQAGSDLIYDPRTKRLGR
jgi:hypothetical protein